MSTKDATIPPGDPVDQAPPPPARARGDASPSDRAHIERAIVGYLRRGNPYKADLLLVDLGDGPFLVKDYADKSWRRRLLGRIQIAREAAAYRHVGSLEGIPRFLGRIDGLALAVEHLRASQLSADPTRHQRAREHLEGLKRVIDGLHRRGLVHLDLRGKSNVLVGEDGAIRVVDLAGAVRFRPGSAAHRTLGRLLASADRHAWLKWKARLLPGELEAGEESALDRYRWLRRLWLFNRRHARPVDPRSRRSR